MTSSVTVVIADDQTVIRQSLATMLDLVDDISVLGVAADGAQAVQLVGEHHPQVLLTDLRMPVMDGVEATRAVCAQYPDTAVVLLTTFDDEQSIISGLQAGARGYLTKDADRDGIVAAIRAAATGQAVIDPGVQMRLVAAVTAGLTPTKATPLHLPEPLTARELEVLGLIGEGLSNREIAGRMVVSESTVKTHINNLFAKAQLRDRADAVRLAIRIGLSDTQ